MANVRDYLMWRGDLPFEKDPLNEVDALILCYLTYIELADIEGCTSDVPIPLKEVCPAYFEKHPYQKDAMGLLTPDEIQDVFLEAVQTRRFAPVLLSRHVNEIDEEMEKQFSAMTFDVTDDIRYVSFRGTDDTIVGWKEDFNMCFTFPVPAQLSALSYLEHAAAVRPDAHLIVGGHSKGGNLAMYAAAHCSEEVFERILWIYNHDGPGFPTPEIADRVYRRIEKKLSSIIPEASMVGILMEYRDNFRLVKSDVAGPLQHNGLTWEVKGPAFDVLTETPKALQRKKKTLHAWLREMDLSRRREMVENMFAIRHNIEAKTLLELTGNPSQTLPAIFESYDKETREVLSHSLRLLVKEEKTSLREALKAEQQKLKQMISENVQEALETLTQRNRKEKQDEPELD